MLLEGWGGTGRRALLVELHGPTAALLAGRRWWTVLVLVHTATDHETTTPG